MNKSLLETKLIPNGGGSKLLVAETSSFWSRRSIIQKIDLNGFFYIQSILLRSYPFSTFRSGYSSTYIRSAIVGDFCVS